MSKKPAKRRKLNGQFDHALSDVCDQLSRLCNVGSVSTRMKGCNGSNDEACDYVVRLDLQTGCGPADAKIAAASTSRCIGVYSAACCKPLKNLGGHEDMVTGVKFAHKNHSLLFSSSKDATVRCWDLRTGTSPIVFNGFEQVTLPFTSVSVSADDMLLCAGSEADSSEDVYMVFWDARKPGPMGYYRESHQDDITEVKFHPTRSELLLTGAMDGLLCYFDVDQSCEDDALLYTHNVESSLSTAGWWGDNSMGVYGCTNDGCVRVYDGEGDAVFNFEDIREGASTVAADYVVDCLPCGSSLLLLLGTFSGELRMCRLLTDNAVTGDNQQLHLVASLTGGHTSTVRCCAWDTENKVLYTGGDDSKLIIWGAPSSADTAE